MRLSLTAYLLLVTCAAGQTAQLRWDVQQDRPVSHDVYIWQGETVDLMPRLVQGTQPVAVTNAPVELRYREAALAADQYRSVAAAANTNSGVLLVRWLPDYDAGADWYDYQIIVGSNAANPRAFGRITMRPTLGWPASTNAPPPVTLYPTRDDLQAISNALAEAVQPIGPRIASMESRTNTWDYASTLPDLWSRFGAHVDDILTNPHSVRADQIGAATTQQLAAAVAPLASTQQLAAAVAPLASTQQLAAAVVAIQIPVQSVNAKTGAVVLAAADVGAVASSGDAYVSLSDGVTAFSVSTSFGERIALDSVDQAIHIFRDGTVELYDYESERGFRELSLFDVPTYADLSAAPAWQVYTNIASSVTITNDLERPVRIYGDGSATGTVSFAALREPLPVYVEASGFPGIVWSNAYTVGGGFWQTNAVNVFLVWQSGTNTFVNPVTARPL